MMELVIDGFAGGGGASDGIRRAIGRDPDLAYNHDAEALAMHRANHPGTRHICRNIMQIDPLAEVGLRRVGLIRLAMVTEAPDWRDGAIRWQSHVLINHGRGYSVTGGHASRDAAMDDAERRLKVAMDGTQEGTR